MALQHLRSSTANKRPTPAAMADGQLAVNTEATSPGLFFKNASGDLVKVGPVHVGTTAPNATPASGGQAGNTLGEQWLDTSGANPVLKVWDGSTWQSETGEFVNASGDTMTGALVMDNQQQIRFRETTANGTNYVALQAPASLAADVTYTLPAADGTSGQVLSTNGSGALSFTTVDKISAGNTSAEVIDTGSDGRFVVTTEGSERLRCDSSGRLLVGTSSARANFFNSTFSPLVQFEGANNDGARLQSFTYGRASSSDGPIFVLAKCRDSSVGGNTVVASGDQLGWLSFQGSDGTQFVEGASIRAEVDGTPGADDMPGRLVFSTTPDSGSSPVERMRISNNGDVLIGTTGFNGANKGFGVGQNGFFYATNTNDLVSAINRLGNDGTLISLQQDSVAEGSISVSGTTVSYNGAHLSRWSQIQGVDPHDKTDRPEILRGTVMSNLDEMCEWCCPESSEAQDNEQLNKTKISDVEGDKNVAGVFQSWDDDDNTWVNDYYLAMTGDFVIRIAEGVTVERGDLLMSAGDGTAKPQDDDIIRSKTIAKVTSTNVSCTYDDGSYCVPCVLMAC